MGGMSQSASVIESEDVEEESDEEDNVKPKISGQGKEGRKSRRKLKTKLKNELSTISTVMEVKGQEMMRIRKHVNLKEAVQGGREIPRQDAVNESKIERTLQQYDCECERVLAWLRRRVKFN